MTVYPHPCSASSRTSRITLLTLQPKPQSISRMKTASATNDSLNRERREIASRGILVQHYIRNYDSSSASSLFLLHIAAMFAASALVRLSQATSSLPPLISRTSQSGDSGSLPERPSANLTSKISSYLL